jgi:hypothetical protein
MVTLVETNCKANDSIACYAKRPANGSNVKGFFQTSHWTFTDWHGNQIGTGAVTGSWRTGPYATRMYSFVVRLPDGRVFNCRGQGDGMLATGKLAKR